MQREPGALRDGDRARVAAACSQAMCERERCPFAVVGVATDERAARWLDRRTARGDAADARHRHADGRAARQAAEDAPRRAARRASSCQPLDLDRRRPGSRSAFDVLRHPTVASKRFLITIGDRTVGGLSHRDQMVGPVAGAGGRLRRDAGRLRGLSRRGDEHGRAHAAGRARCAGLRPHGGGRGHHQPAGRADRARRASSCQRNWMAACGEPGRGRRAVRHRARRSAWSCARRWASACRSARTACRCARAGRRRRRSRSRSPRRSA